jgi:hypothetical protein
VRIDDGDSTELLTYERANGRQKRWKCKFKLRKQAYEFIVHTKRHNQKCSFYKHIFVNKKNEIQAVRTTGYADCVKLTRRRKAAGLLICRLLMRNWRRELNGIASGLSIAIVHYSNNDPSCIRRYYYQSQLIIPRQTTYLANKVFQTSPGDS